jgi:hypothetical protein
MKEAVYNYLCVLFVGDNMTALNAESNTGGNKGSQQYGNRYNSR